MDEEAFPLLGRDADQRVGWQFWRWPEEIRRLRRSQLGLLRRLNAMHVRAGKAEGWINEDGDALVDITKPRKT